MIEVILTGSLDRGHILLVRLVKEYSGLSLMESKYICEELIEKGIVKFSILDKYDEFKKELSSLDVKFHLESKLESTREFNLLSLGIGEDKDYIERISKYLNLNLDNKSKIIKFVLSKLDKDSLIETINIIENDSYL